MDYSFDFTSLTAADMLRIAAVGETVRTRPLTADETLGLLTVFNRYIPVDLYSVPYRALTDVFTQAAAAFGAHAATLQRQQDATPEADRLLGSINLDELLD